MFSSLNVIQFQRLAGMYKKKSECLQICTCRKPSSWIKCQTTSERSFQLKKYKQHMKSCTSDFSEHCCTKWHKSTQVWKTTIRLLLLRCLAWTREVSATFCQLAHKSAPRPSFVKSTWANVDISRPEEWSELLKLITAEIWPVCHISFGRLVFLPEVLCVCKTTNWHSLWDSAVPKSRCYWLADSQASIQSPYTSIGSDKSGRNMSRITNLCFSFHPFHCLIVKVLLMQGYNL